MQRLWPLMSARDLGESWLDDRPLEETALSQSKSSRFSQDLKAHLTCWVLPSQGLAPRILKCPWVFYASVFKCKLTYPLGEKATLRRLHFLATVAQPETFSRSSCKDQICDSFFSCLGTRSSGPGSAIEKHHQDGADKFHSQLPQGKSNPMVIFPGEFEKYIRGLYVSWTKELKWGDIAQYVCLVHSVCVCYCEPVGYWVCLLQYQKQ